MHGVALRRNLDRALQDLARVLLATRVERDAPDPCPLDLDDRRRQSGDAGDRQQLDGTRARLDRNGRQGSAAMLGDDRAVGTRDLRAAQDRAEVLWVHDRIKRDQQGWSGVQELLEGSLAARL